MIDWPPNQTVCPAVRQPTRPRRHALVLQSPRQPAAHHEPEPHLANPLHRLWWGLKETGAKLANGRKVFNRNDAVVWLIEQLQERP